MKSKTLFLAMWMSIGLIGISCSEEEVADKLLGDCMDISTDWQNISEAAATYSENPTVTNCEAYKAAMLNFYQEYKDCPYYDEGDYQEDINDVKNMDCSGS